MTERQETQVQARPYQDEMLRNVFADWIVYRTLLAMSATGTGKTIMFLRVVDEIFKREPDARVMILAHTDELIKQPAERIAEYFPHLLFKLGIVKAKQRDVSAQLIIASVQSLSEERCDQIATFGDVTHIIVDEAHHAVADTYQVALDWWTAAPYILGVTATPKRSDNERLRSVFEHVTFKYSIQDAIRDGYLCPFTPLGFKLPLAMPLGWIPAENSTDEGTGNLLSADNIMQIVFDNWRKYAGDRLSIFFCSSVAMAHRYAAFFNDQGVPSAAVSGASKDRAELLEQFKAGEIRCMFNMKVLTEGFDAPEIACVGMLAPTESDLVYVQRLGRGLRLAEGKTDCIVLDFAPATDRELVFAVDLLDGVPKRVRSQWARAQSAGVEIFGLEINEAGEVGVIDPESVDMEVLDYLRKRRAAWTFDGVFATASLSEKLAVCVIAPERKRIEKATEMRRSGNWTDRHDRLLQAISSYRLYRCDKPEGRRYWSAEYLGSFDNIDDAQVAAEELNEHAVAALSEKRQKWRKRPASEAQLDVLRNMGELKQGEELTRGQASQRISHVITVKAVTKQEKRRQERATA